MVLTAFYQDDTDRANIVAQTACRPSRGRLLRPGGGRLPNPRPRPGVRRPPSRDLQGRTAGSSGPGQLGYAAQRQV